MQQKNWMYVLVALIVIMLLFQVFLLMKINSVEEDVNNIGEYLSNKIDTENIKLNELLDRMEE